MTIEKSARFKDSTDNYVTLIATGKVILGQNYTQPDISHEFIMTFKNPGFEQKTVARSESYINDYLTKI
jgi:hypothetical protein